MGLRDKTCDCGGTEDKDKDNGCYECNFRFTQIYQEYDLQFAKHCKETTHISMYHTPY